MERLQKKCLVGSLVSHGVLVVVLAVATAFGSKTFKPNEELQTKAEKLIPINLLDITDVTDGESRQGGGGGGGSPAAAPAQPSPAPAVQPPPAAAPQPPIVQPPPKAETVKLPEPEPEPPVEVPKPMALEAISITPPKKAATPTPTKKPTTKAPPVKPEPVKPEPTKATIKPNLNTVVRPNGPKPTKAQTTQVTRPTGPSAEDIRAENNRRRDIANAIGKTFEGLDRGLSQSGGGLDVASFGAGSGKGWGGGSGPTLMNYAQYVREIYDLNWIVTDNVIGDAGIVRVEIVVQRNGAARGKIIKSSGNAMLDRSVQNALDKVKNIGRPFPEGATDSSRTFTINFNLTSKRGTG